MRRQVALVAVVLLAGCGGSAGEEATPATAGPSTVSSAPASNATLTTAAAPTETLSTAVVAGPPALEVLGGDGVLRWEAPPMPGFTVAMQAVVGDGVVFGSSFCDGPVAAKAWDLASGETLWSTVLPDSLGGGARLAVADGVALVSTAGGLVALDARTGDELWHADQAILWGAAGSTVLVSMGDASSPTATSMSGLDLAGGAERWTVDLSGTSYMSGAALDGDRAYATIYSDPVEEVAAIALSDGSELWRVRLSPGSDRSSVEATTGLAVGSPSDSSGIATAAVDGATGQEVWRVRGWGLRQQVPGVSFSGDGSVYATDYEAQAAVGALDGATGAVRWSKSVPELGSSNYLTLGAVDGGLLLLIDGAMVLLDAADGSERWRTAPAGYLLAAADDVLAFGPECPNLGD